MHLIFTVYSGHIWLLFSVVRPPLFWPWEGSNYPSRSCNCPNLKLPKFNQNKNKILTAFLQNLDYCTNLFRAPYLPSPYLPAASPGIFVGEEGRGSGGRGHNLETNLPPTFFFSCCRALNFANTVTTHFREKTRLLPVGSTPSLLHEMRGRHGLTLPSATPLRHARN